MHSRSARRRKLVGAAGFERGGLPYTTIKRRGFNRYEAINLQCE